MTRSRFLEIAALLLVLVAGRSARADLAHDLANAMDIPDELIISASLEGSDPRGAKVMNAGDFRPAFVQQEGGQTIWDPFPPAQGPTFALLSTGFAENATQPDFNNDESYEGRDHLAGDGSADDMSGKLLGRFNSQGNDLVQLKLVLRVPPGMGAISFEFAYYTEEFPEFVHSEFNDFFVCEIGESTFTINPDNTISAPDNICFDASGNPISVNALFGFDPTNPNPDTGTTYDGTTGHLITEGPIPVTPTLAVIFTISDMGDSILDSAVAIDNFRFLPSSSSPTATTELHSALVAPELVSQVVSGVPGIHGGGCAAGSGEPWALAPLGALCAVALLVSRRRRGAWASVDG